VRAVLDDFHAAAAAADGPRYFGHFTADAVFIGTDPAERWPLAAFRRFAEPYLAQGRGWTYHPGRRHVELAPDGGTAWFDEMLDNAKYGVCRGTGVLVRERDRWRIAQYALAIPVPNELAADLVDRIRAAGDP
jgi:ketosteroid isomerase-like protein